MVHYFVALAFLGPCPKGKEVNHKNFDTSDNRRVNLEYVTKSENQQHAAKFGRLNGERMSRKGTANYRAKLTELTAAFIQVSTEPTRALAERYRVSMSTIQRVRNGSRWRHVS